MPISTAPSAGEGTQEVGCRMAIALPLKPISKSKKKVMNCTLHLIAQCAEEANDECRRSEKPRVEMNLLNKSSTEVRTIQNPLCFGKLQVLGRIKGIGP